MAKFSGGSRRGRQPHGRRGYISYNLYVKTKELGLLGVGAPAAPWICHYNSFMHRKKIALKINLFLPLWIMFVNMIVLY